MGEVRKHEPSEALTLDAIASAAWVLEAPMPHERKWVLRSGAGILIDKLLARCARGRGALDVAIGDGLAAMAVGDRVIQLGFSGIGDTLGRSSTSRRAQRRSRRSSPMGCG